MQYPEVWAMFFSSVVGFQYHPGMKIKLSLIECAQIADDMYAQYMLRMRGDVCVLG